MSGAGQDVAIRGNVVARIVIHVALFLFAIYYLLPLWVMLVNAFKPLAEIRGGNMLAPPPTGPSSPGVRPGPRPRSACRRRASGPTS